MKPPTCKLCGKAHWSYEDHAGMEPSVPEYVKDMAKGAMGGTVPRYAAPFVDHLSPQIETTQSYEPPIIVTRDEKTVTKRNNVTPVTKLLHAPPEAVKEVQPLITRRALGRPKTYRDAAARQRAYRERK